MSKRGSSSTLSSFRIDEFGILIGGPISRRIFSKTCASSGRQKCVDAPLSAFAIKAISSLEMCGLTVEDVTLIDELIVFKLSLLHPESH